MAAEENDDAGDQGANRVAEPPPTTSPETTSVDLRSIQPTPQIGSSVSSATFASVPAWVSLSGSKTYNLGATQEKIALRILWILTAIIATIFLLSVVLGGWCFFDKAQCDASGNALRLVTGTTKDIFTAMLGLAGSVVGFYFGQRDRDNASQATTSL
jgi:hypothetical protein